MPSCYPGSIAMTTPQTFTMASPPAQSTGYEVGRHTLDGSRALHPGPYPPDLSRLIAYGTSGQSSSL